MTTFLDSAVFMYAAGASHPLKEACSRIISRAARRELDAVTSAEVVQEVLHRYGAIGRRSGGVALARQILVQFQPVLSFSDSISRRLPDLVERYPALEARDLVHVATCIQEGIETLITPDRGFDAVTEIKRLDPFEAAL